LTNLNLNDGQQKKLKALLDCVEIEDLAKLNLLVAHAKDIDDVMKVVDSISLLGSLSRKVALYLAVMLASAAAISGHLQAWLKGFLLGK
jgi:hypothetical protein